MLHITMEGDGENEWQRWDNSNFEDEISIAIKRDCLNNAQFSQHDHISHGYIEILLPSVCQIERRRWEWRS